MKRNQSRSKQGGELLVYEPDGLVCERVRQMARAEGFGTCAVDRMELFRRLHAHFSFDFFVVGTAGADELEELRLDRKVQPLVLLAPLHERGAAAHYRVAFPDAILVDRGLRDPDALRRALGVRGPRETAPAEVDTVRRTFGPFGLSERQLEVLSRALIGESSAEVARKLFISELTVRNHLHAIYERVGVSGRRELLGRFVRALIGA
ncbi:MAG: LuxR C-terminal-related transcriptional regulator [Myxococcota bacterium]